MSVVALPAPTQTATVRCECAACGAHVEVRRSWQLTGQCRNCRSYELRPLAPAGLPPAGPTAVVVPLRERWAA